MTRVQCDEWQRTLGYLASETRRFEAEVLADVEVTLLPTGAAPDPMLCELVRLQRDNVRSFGRALDRYAARPRGRR